MTLAPRRAARAVLALGLVLGSGAEGAETRDGARVRFRPSGHVKGFLLGVFPYDAPFLPEQPFGQGILDVRLNLELRAGAFFAEGAHAVTAFLGDGGAAASPLGSAGVGVQAPEAVDLTWEAFSDGPLRLLGRTDRLVVGVDVPGVRIAVGRQPITFGSGLFFTPLDLVGPFTPATIDSEYKPGFDSVRVDAFVGFSTRITGVATYAGSWDMDDMVLALYGQTTVGVTDLGLFYGAVRGDHVVGATVVSSAGPVGLYGDAVVTVPPRDEDEDAFFRGVIGIQGRPTGTTFLLGEVYVQTLGSTDPADYLLTLQRERWTRGELWLTGLAYVGLSVNQEIVPTLQASVGTFANLTDPSFLLAPSLAWSVSDDADVAVGGYVGLGKRPEVDGLFPALRSEFGTYPATVFAQLKAYW